MRNKEMFLKFEEMKMLYQYLYMDEEHSILIKNAIDVPLSLRMNENGAILCKNMNFPEFEETNWTGNMTLQTVSAIIEQLKKTPSVELPEIVNNRWDEIKTIVSMEIANK